MFRVNSSQVMFLCLFVCTLWACTSQQGGAAEDTETATSDSPDAETDTGIGEDSVAEKETDNACDTDMDTACHPISSDGSDQGASDDSESETSAILDTSSDGIMDTATAGLDNDTDTSSDTNTTSETDTDKVNCAAEQPNCCSPACPCDSERNLQCVPANWNGVGDGTGKCFAKIVIPESASDCWSDADCVIGEFCENALILPCDWTGDMADSQGRCAPASSVGCDSTEDSETCGRGYYCHSTSVETEAICLRILSDNHCWVDADCLEGVRCLNPLICGPNDCCLSEPGLCEFMTSPDIHPDTDLP